MMISCHEMMVLWHEMMISCHEMTTLIRLPFTYAHEYAHLLGVSNEAEAIICG